MDKATQIEVERVASILSDSITGSEVKVLPDIDKGRVALGVSRGKDAMGQEIIQQVAHFQLNEVGNWEFGYSGARREVGSGAVGRIARVMSNNHVLLRALAADNFWD